VRLIVEQGGRIVVLRGYAWNAARPRSARRAARTPDGVVDAHRLAKTYYASSSTTRSTSSAGRLPLCGATPTAASSRC
jgi:hypothetical protein